MSNLHVLQSLTGSCIFIKIHQKVMEMITWDRLYTVNREIFVPFYFCPFRPRLQRAYLRLDELQRL